jgi:hypothetical protein
VRICCLVNRWQGGKDLPATAGIPSSIAIVGSSAEGSAGRVSSRFKIVEPSRTQQMTPIPNDASAALPLAALRGSWQGSLGLQFPQVGLGELEEL